MTEHLTDDGFTIQQVGDHRALLVDSDNIDACVDYYRRHGLDELVVNRSYGYKLNDVDFFKKHDDVTSVTIVASIWPMDVSGLSALRGLRRLKLSCDVDLSLAQFKDLREFNGTWKESLDLAGCPALEVLRLWKYRAKQGDLSTFPALPHLRCLALTQCNLASLKGIARYPHLRELDLSYWPRLRHLVELLPLTELEVLELCNCRKLEDHHVLPGLGKLKKIMMSRCGEIPNLRFIDDMPALEFFSFVDTNVVDGDLRPLIRLKFAGFLRKKHYSHTPEQMDLLMRPHGGFAVARIEDM